MCKVFWGPGGKKEEQELADVAISAGGNKDVVELDPSEIAVVSLFVAAGGGPVTVIVKSLARSSKI